MSKEIIIRLRDDIDNSIGGDVQTYTLTTLTGEKREIDLNANHAAEYELAMLPYIKASRPWKRTKGKGNGKTHQKRATPTWATEINQWATDHGYDWSDVAQRQAVRTWGIQNELLKSKTGLMPRHVLQAHYEMREAGRLSHDEWPFSATGFTT